MSPPLRADVARAFFAVELPRDLRGMLAGFAKRLPLDDVRWIHPDNLHITMRFLGDIERARVPEIVADVEQVLADFDPFEIVPRRLGSFPGRGAPRVWWVGIEKGRQELCEVAMLLERALARHRVREEDRAFSPHVTLGRVRERREVLARRAAPKPEAPKLEAPKPEGPPPAPAIFRPDEHFFISKPAVVEGVTLFESRMSGYDDPQSPDRKGPEYTALARIRFHAGR